MTDLKFEKSSYCGNGACVEMDIASTPDVVMRDGKNPAGPTLTFGREQWLAFVAGCEAGEFGPVPQR